MAIGDIDNDGRVDAIVTTNDGLAYILRNETSPQNHWITLKLVGHKSNRDAIGAEVKLVTVKGQQFATVSTAGKVTCPRATNACISEWAPNPSRKLSKFAGPAASFKHSKTSAPIKFSKSTRCPQEPRANEASLFFSSLLHLGTFHVPLSLRILLNATGLGSATNSTSHARAQAPPPSKPSGMASGGAHAPVKDALSRPITAGGFVDGAPIVFLDITKQSGLDKFRHRSGTPEKSTIIDAPGSGVALIDYDNDGWLDIYLLNGSYGSRHEGQGGSAARHALPQQSRRHFHRCHRQSRRRQRAMGIRRGRGRLRQRRLARHLCRQLRQEPPLPQQP